MSKIQRYQRELQLLFTELFQTGDEKKLTEYLLVNSNLPGRRANLELAKAFIMVIEEYWEKDDELLWDFIVSYLNITPSHGSVNDPQEFLPFCATWALGSIGGISEVHYKDSLYYLRELAKDSRWRIREAVTKGIHKLIEDKRYEILKELQTWIDKDQCLTMRAVVTGVAEPSLLKEENTAKQALKLHKEVIGHIKNIKNLKSEEFKILRKGLAYSLSVVIQAVPEDGFEYLEELIAYQDKDILYIIKQNLNKNRLIRNYPAQVNRLKMLLK